MKPDVSTAVAWHFWTMAGLLILVAAAFALSWSAFRIELLPIPLVYVLAIVWFSDQIPPLFWRRYKEVLPKSGIYGALSPVSWLIALAATQGLSVLVGALYVKKGGVPAYGFTMVFAVMALLMIVLGAFRSRSFRAA